MPYDTDAASIDSYLMERSPISTDTSAPIAGGPGWPRRDARPRPPPRDALRQRVTRA